MKTRVLVVPDGAVFRLRTSLGFPIGPRMLSVAPEPGKDYPEIQDTFTTKLEADRAAVRFNTYLLWAEKKKSKQKSRISE